MRRVSLFAFAVILLSLALPQLLAQNSPQQTASRVLQVVDTDPLSGQELGLDDSITLYFDRQVSCDTIANAFSITPSTDGTIDCDGTALTFTPTNGFERANTYRIQLMTSLRGADDAQLLEPFTFELDTTGFLQVSETFPAPQQPEVETDTKITIIFNRPVVPLGILEERDDLVNPITIQPTVEGTGEWLNTSIYVFEPSEGLVGGQQYTVSIASGLTTTDGAVLPNDYNFTFNTVPPRVIDFFPNENTNRVPVDRMIQMRFNQAMNRASVEAAFSLAPTGEQMGSQVTGTFEWADDNMGFSFTPTASLALGTRYAFGITGQIQSASGGMHVLDVGNLFETVPFPRVVGISPSDGDTEVSPYYGSVLISFASPMNVETLAERISISPEPSVEPQYFYREWSDSYEVSFPLAPSTTYTISVEAGMEDVLGNATTEGASSTFTTEAYDPEVRLNVPSAVGFYNAYREPTQVFVTYRNMGAFDMALYELPLERFGQMATDERTYYYDFFNMSLGNENLIYQWTIDGSNVPQNALRFDLLEFDETLDSFGGVACQASLPTRLRNGDTALVTSDPDPVRARSQPETGEIVDLLYRGYALPIVGDPVCGSDGLAWIPVVLRDGRQAWVAESVEDEYLISPRELFEAPVEITNDDGSALAPGLYFLKSTAPDFRDEGHVMVVSTANLVVKNSTDTVTVWATNVQTGEPLVGVPLRVYSEGYTLVGSGFTNDEGMMTLPLPEIDNLYERRLVLLETDEHFGLGWSEFTDGIEPYQFSLGSDFYPNDYRIYVYTDRPVYRPGQPVYFKGIVRSRDDVSYTVPQDETVFVTIRDDRGDIIFERNLPINEFGSFSGQLDVAEDASLGSYYIQAEMPSQEEYSRETGGISFSVAEYRLPEYLVNVEAQQSEVVQGDMVNVTISANFFFGGSVSDATVQYSVVAENHFFNYEGNGRYDFIDYNYDAGPSAFFASNNQGAIASGEGVTDENGQFVIEVPADLGNVSQSQNLVIEAVVRDESGQVVAGRAEVVVHQGNLYVGASPENYVSRTGEESTINVIAVDWDSNPVANQDVEIELVRRQWFSVQEMDSRGRTTWTWEVEEIPAGSDTLTTDSNGLAEFTFTPADGGSYKAYVRTRDDEGNLVNTSAFLWVSSRTYVQWRQQNSNRIELIADADEYNVGDTAEILITSPFQGETQALVTVERGDVLNTEIITLDNNSYVYELPIREDYSPNVYVSVTIVKGVDENNPVAGFRMGYVQLGVDTTRRELNIDITSDVDRTSPQQTVTYTVRTTDWAGDPVAAEVGVGVTDLAALSLAEDNSRPLMNFFYGDQNLGVRTSTALTANTDQLTQEVIDTIKGGGGGGGGLGGIVEVRGEFIDTPYWNPNIVTDATGVATFDVRFPDNLTTWRLNARAHTLAPDGNMLVGQDTFDLLSTKPIIVRPVTPRFFVVDDRVVLAAVVNNNTAEEQTAVVAINAEGVTLNSERAQQVTIPADGRVRVEWEATVDNADFARMSFTADAGQFSDGSISGVSIDDDGTLPIYKYEAPETVGTSGVLRNADSRIESIALPRRFDVTRGTLTVQVDKSVAGATLDGLDYLRNYPHQCTEQTVSRFLPNIMTVRAFQDLGLSDPLLESQLDFQVNFGLQKLLAEQHSDGGWGWFVQSPSDTLVTSYVLLGLWEAKQQGYVVPDRVIANGQEYLRREMPATTPNQSFTDANRKAFILYVLARTGAADVNRTTAHYDQRDNLSLYGKALLAEAFYYIDPAETTRSDVLINELVNAASLSAAGAHWDEEQVDYANWNTDTRTTAMVLSALTKLRPNSDLIPNVVRYLITQREADAWESTQETAWAVMALTDYMDISGELEPNYDYNVTFNGDVRLEGQADPATVRDSETFLVDVSEMVSDTANELTFTRTGSNDGSLYYTAYLETYLPVPEIDALENGIIVERRYTVQGDESETPVTQATIGDVIQVRLTVIVPEARHYVLIDSPHPAGAEAIDPNLETSQQVGTRPGLDNDNPLRYGWGWWYFDNISFEDEKVSIYATYLPAGTYEYVYAIRPGVEGTFNVIPATAEEFYFPDVYGRSAGMEFTVHSAD